MSINNANVLIDLTTASLISPYIPGCVTLNKPHWLSLRP